MSAQRKAARHAVIDRLKAADTAAGQRVEGSKVTETLPSKLPVINVYTLDDESDPATHANAPRILTRNVKIVIEILAEAKAGAPPIDDVLDDIGEQVEIALGQDLTLNGTVADSVFEEAAVMFGKAGDRHYGRLMILIDAVYQRRWDRDGVAVNLSRVDARTDIGSLPPANEAQDQITIEQ